MSMFIPADRRSSVRSTRTPLQGGGGATKSEHQPHALEQTLPSAIEADREAVPVASG
jgi:hypothetical protein